jgi:hypothetical protein
MRYLIFEVFKVLSKNISVLQNVTPCIILDVSEEPAVLIFKVEETVMKS